MQIILALFVLLNQALSHSGTSFESTPVFSCSRSADSLVLVDLYNGLDGPNWFTKWNLNAPITTWVGIVLDGSGCVSRINLSGNNLKGTLPNSIGNLGNLKILNLLGNKIQGFLPVSIGNLQLLEDLVVDGNLLSGSIPNSYSNLQNLKFLSLSGNEFSGSFPQVVTDLTNLVQINLANNAFTSSIPNSIGNLTNLEILDLSSNKFTGTLPSTFSLLTKLREFFIHNNQCSGDLPTSLANLTNLKNVWLQNNKFTGRFPNILNSPLNSLKLDHNLFTNIPDFSTINTWNNSDPFGLTITYNNFTFEDLIPLQKIPRIVNYLFKPQNSIVLPEIIIVDKGTNYNINLNIDLGILDNNYKWFKDTALVFISNENSYQFFQVREEDEGNYSGRVTNVAIPEFEITIEPTRIIFNDPARCNNPPAGQSCETPLEFCSTSVLHNYCGFLPIPDTSLTLGFFCDSTELLDNAKFISFQAPADSIIIEIIPHSCDIVNENGVDYEGIQASISQNCNGEKKVLYCRTVCQPKPFYIGGDQFIRGEKYTLTLDGCKGSTCQYIIKVIAGKESFSLIEPSAIEGKQAFCPDSLDHFFSIDKISGAQSYLWYLNDSLKFVSVDTQINVRNLNSGIYQLKVRAINICDTTNFSSILFQVYPKMQLTTPVVNKFGKDSVYIISFDVLGGSPPYKLLNGNGSLDSIDGNFKSDSILCNSPYDFIISDKRECVIEYAGFESCGCNSVAGNFSNDTLVFCEGRNILMSPPSNIVKDSGDVAGYVMFTNPNNFKGSVIRISNSGAFSFDPSTMRFNTYYYIVYAISRPKGLNQLNLDHPCLSISSVKVFIYRPKPIVSAGADRSFCGLEGLLNGFGTYKSSLWEYIAGPGNVIIDSPHLGASSIRVDLPGAYRFSIEGFGEFCSSRDEVIISFSGNTLPAIQGFPFVCMDQTTELIAPPGFLTYNWSTSENSQKIIIKDPGTYCVSVTDQNGCMASNCIVVNSSIAPTPIVLGPTELCDDKEATLNLDQKYLTYSWSAGQKTDRILIDSGGRYCVTITGDNGCKAEACIDIKALPKSYFYVLDSTPCFNNPYTYLDKIYNSPGKYEIAIGKVNSFNCDSVVLLELLSPAKLILADTNITKDNGTANGSIRVTPAGGKPPYTYLWNTGRTTSTISNLIAGNYYVRVEDQNNCFDTFYFIVGLNTANLDVIKNTGPKFYIYPNPASSDQQINIHSKQASGEWNLRIYQSDSKMILNKSIYIESEGQNILVETKLLPGVYYLSLQKGQESNLFLRLTVFN